MKVLDMPHKYIEVKGGGHIRVAFDHFPQIFDYFDAHQKKDLREEDRRDKKPEQPADKLDKTTEI